MRAFLYAVALGASMLACASEGETTPAPSTDVGANTPAPAAPSGPPASAPKENPPADDPKSDCKVDGMTGVEDVVPSFVIYKFPTEIPATMKGGTLSGQYAVLGAKVYLPAGTESLVYPDQSTGKVNAWAVFDGTSYRLHLKGDFTVLSVQGPLTQGVDSESQGGFSVDSEVILLDHACDAATDQEADYSFTDDGSGKATIVVKVASPYGDTYMQLDATKM
jgi:hypothetical protein